MVVIFFAQLLLLFFLSRIMTSELSYLFHSIVRSKRFTVWLMAILFLPGTVIHEFSHALMAHLLFVYVGKMELMPQLHDETLKLGSVEVGKTDIVRNFFIGIAPFVVGTSLMLLVLSYTFENSLIGFNLFSFFILYVLFVISNTMYSSKKDMEGAVEFFLLIVGPILFLYFLGFRIPGFSNWLSSDGVENIMYKSNIFLLVPLILDIAFISFAKILRKS